MKYLFSKQHFSHTKQIIVNIVHYANQVSLLTFATSSYDRELNANPEDRQRRLSCETPYAPIE